MTKTSGNTSVEEFLSTWDRRVGASREHTSTVDGLLALYRGQGLLPGDDDQPLMTCCPNAAECWGNAPCPRAPDHAGIAVPWIGERYFESRVVLLGLNFDNWGGLGAHYSICESHIEQQLAGKRGKDGRAFGRGAMQYLRLVLAGLNGVSIPDDSSAQPNRELARLWEDCSFLQAVKCAPGTQRSTPSAAMLRNCPPFLLLRELEILKPSVILVFGRTHLRDVVRLWAVPERGYGQEQGPRIERDLASIGGKRPELISVNHPSSRGSAKDDSLKQLTDSIRRSPLGSPPLK